MIHLSCFSTILGKEACAGVKKLCKVCDQLSGQWKRSDDVTHLIDDNCTHSKLLRYAFSFSVRLILNSFSFSVRYSLSY